MKLVRFGAKGAEKPGILDAQGRVRSLEGVVADWGGLFLADEWMAHVRTLDRERLPLVAAGTRLGACVANSPKFLCIGLNYADHAAETGATVPSEPVVFAKSTSAICGPNDEVEIPRGAQKTDWEVELGVVIGVRTRHVEERDALAHVAGYCVVNDLSEREYQLERTGQWTKGKSCDTFGPIGPWLVTRDEVPDPQQLGLWLEVDGVRRQTGNTRTMVFGVATLVSYLSRFMTLEPGDVISTGTPPGVGLGMKPPLYLHAGQVMRLWIDGLGEQCQLTVPAS
ncbi:MAG: fumarylacetoacetate hydrolase family protein [Planctomycetes bacterium]|nr:fumarylacetoacetate hydrolase family protein [Planctomycetota bacterium]